MRKKRKGALRKKVFNPVNVMIIACSIVASYSGVALSNTIADLKSEGSKVDSLVLSTHRIAVAFEEYNDKRFRP